MKKVFVSGCFDLLHCGHVNFLSKAAKYGRLYVALGSDKTIMQLKQKTSVYDERERKYLLESLKCVHKVYISPTPLNSDSKLDFEAILDIVKPDIFYVNEDGDSTEKRELIESKGIEYIVDMREPEKDLLIRSTTSICSSIKASKNVPLRIDFAGGWLDVPKYHVDGTYIVNCAISPTVSLSKWNYRKFSGLGGSGAWAVLNGIDPIKSELELGAGWQDGAVILETGACVWKSGNEPILDFKNTGDFLKGKIAIFDTHQIHDTPALKGLLRDFSKIAEASKIARDAVLNQDVQMLAKAVHLSYLQQLAERMNSLPDIPKSLGCKYCGSGHGGYALYLFADADDREAALVSNENLYPVEPYCKQVEKDQPIPWENKVKYLYKFYKAKKLTRFSMPH